MANYQVNYKIGMTDINGDTAFAEVIDAQSADTLTLAVAATNAANIATALANCSNAKVTSQGIYVTFIRAQISAATAPPPTNAVYPSVTDGARLQFANSAGNRRAITVPAPILSDFVTDTNTVNPADTNVAALIAVVEGFNDIGGATTNLYEGGVKVSHHARRRASRKRL